MKLARVIWLSLLALLYPGHLLAAKEALLIANADYSHFGKLPNPISDARQLADVLRQLGFNVNVVENASKEAMLDALASFEERLKASRGIAFFHYGGHGVQLDGKNFLIPADAEIPAENRLATRAVDFDEIMGALETSGSEANVVVLDACRDNPLPATASRSTTRGLSVVARPPKNSIIIYAAEAGSKAQDGLFTPTLSRAIAASGNRDISEVMKQIRKEVFTRSDGTQTPGEYSQLFDPLILASEAVAPPSMPPQLPLSSPSASSIMPLAPDPQQAVLDYYTSINRGDYTTAWGMLPASLQTNKRIHPQGFSSFQSWFQGLRPLTVTDIGVVDQSDSRAIVAVDYRFMIDGRSKTEDLRYTLTWNQSLQRWQIESIKQNR